MSTDRILINGIRVFAYHGVLESEKEEGQEFLIDVEVEADLGPAATEDDLAMTVDYAALSGSIARIAGTERYDLIESLAYRLAEHALEHDRVLAVTVTVRKPGAPLDVEADSVGVTVRRTRRGGGGVKRAYLGLGSNLGKRLENLEGAVRALGGSEGVSVVAVSGVYRSEPVGPPGQPEYLNAAVAVDTDLGPERLLELAHEIERLHGRERAERWGPRTLDVDILLYGEEAIDGEFLAVPHPRLGERGFVLEPLAEIAPDAVLPDGTAVRSLLERLDGGGGVALDRGLVIRW